MSTLGTTVRDLQRSLFERPDDLMLDIGAGGELLLARLRAAISLLLFLLPLLNWLTDGTLQETLAGLTGVILANVLAQAWLALAKHRRRYRWLPFVTSASDLGMVTLVLVLLLRIDPAGALNSMVVFAIYLLVIFVTALRNDGRVTLFAGALALLQYGGLVLWTFLSQPPDTLLFSPEYGTASVSNQAQRVVLLVATTLITAVIVYRMQRLVAMSGIDGLTGLPNRALLVHRVPQMLEDAREEGAPITLALIDLDHFKRINDELGHLAGDRALRHAVRCLREPAEPGEMMIRIGGEQFVLLLRHPMGTAWERVEALRRRLADTPFVPEAGEAHRSMTFSAGLASFPQDGADVSSLMRQADLRLRAAKRLGRNRTVARDEPA
ncbi:GGDEF domain-containing protein [Rehaibacterium terrae]|uniref:diguanylate cyclase n=1 Tax=Rehaibacterium terrae TaxID=1341696 RepID=A0A7W8DDS9_9GAMM|nr:GGDEF domain-containing protein [Rehaibacterium terrae]MBB5015079.1 diguanylate cyclase (GGDEF)-like protein [Rehaibacterium terrae]